MMQYSLEIELMIGMDDVAHNRLYSFPDGLDGPRIHDPRWGKRNPKMKCYCKKLRQLGIRR